MLELKVTVASTLPMVVTSVQFVFPAKASTASFGELLVSRLLSFAVQLSKPVVLPTKRDLAGRRAKNCPEISEKESEALLPAFVSRILATTYKSRGRAK
jgi:hypothetical protein